MAKKRLRYLLAALEDRVSKLEDRVEFLDGKQDYEEEQYDDEEGCPSYDDYDEEAMP